MGEGALQAEVREKCQSSFWQQQTQPSESVSPPPSHLYHSQLYLSLLILVQWLFP